MLVYPYLTPHPCAAQKANYERKAFTLIELLMVMAVIAILSAITFGIATGVRNAQARAKAQAELALIAQSLESFKNSNGDYPWARDDENSTAEEVFNALMGWKKFDFSDPENPQFLDKSSGEVPDQGPEAYLEIGKISYIKRGEPEDYNPELTTTTIPTDYILVDPWGNPYRYDYKSADGDSWENFGFVLYSMGPDGEDTPLGSDGILTPELRSDENNIDNIYAAE